MDTDPVPQQQIFLFFFNVLEQDMGTTLIYAAIGLVTIGISILISAFFSGSENAFFSLNPNDLILLNEENSTGSTTALELINEPDRKTATKRLLATILLMNNLVNVFIVIFSAWLFNFLFNFANPLVGFLIQAVFITFLLVLLGEIIPKIYATQNNLKIIRMMAKPLQFCYIVFKPLILLLVGTSTVFDRYIKRNTHSISMEEISRAIDIADEDREIEEKHILKGIINFGNISVKQVMKPRTEVDSIDISAGSVELMKCVAEWNYSRIPVYEENFDNIKGILYIKDLLPYLHHEQEFEWHSLLRTPMFVPEFKKIDDLLEEFQEKRIHMAIVVDEYGGSQGIITMEDILEEVFGEIRDEFDDDELVYSQLDDDTFVFEAKTSLNDIAKILNIQADHFDGIRGDADTLGGLIMEIHEGIPQKGQEIVHEGFTFVVESADSRKIKRVKVIFSNEQSETEKDV